MGRTPSSEYVALVGLNRRREAHSVILASGGMCFSIHLGRLALHDQMDPGSRPG